MLRQDHDKHASNSPVTFVTHKRFVVLFFLQSCCKLITIRVTFPPSLAPVPTKTNQCQRKLGWDLAGYAVEKKNRRVSTTGLASLANSSFSFSTTAEPTPRPPGNFRW